MTCEKLPFFTSASQYASNDTTWRHLGLFPVDRRGRGLIFINLRYIKGPSIKYVTLEVGEGVQEGVTVCDRGDGGSRACDVTLIQIFIIHMKHEI